MKLRGTDFVTRKSGEAGRCSRLADMCRQQVRQWVGGFGKSETVWDRRYWNRERGNRGNRARIWLLPARRKLRVIKFNYPGCGKIDMADINGIGMGCQRLMSVNFGSVMVPIAAMLVRPRQMGVRRRPLHRHENGQQDKIGRGAKALLDQEKEDAMKNGSHCIPIRIHLWLARKTSKPVTDTNTSPPQPGYEAAESAASKG